MNRVFRHQENVYQLLTFGEKKRGAFCTSLLKMNSGINFFWVLGSFSTFCLFHSYKLVHASACRSPKKFVAGLRNMMKSVGGRTNPIIRTLPLQSSYTPARMQLNTA